jgi:hypothetical protein
MIFQEKWEALRSQLQVDYDCGHKSAKRALFLMNELDKKEVERTKINMDEICRKCEGKCCAGDIDVHPVDEIYNDGFLTREVTNKNYKKVMKTHGHNGACIALENGICSIYEKRPAVCRLFVVGSACCCDFQSQILKKHKCDDCHITASLLK